MQFIGDIIDVALTELFDLGVIDIDDSMTEFIATCEIEISLGSISVTMCDWYIWIMYSERDMHTYHAAAIADCVPCDCCTQSVAIGHSGGMWI